MEKSLTSFKQLYIHELQDLYSAETQLLDALSSLAQAASHDDLRAAFNEHRAETETQLNRLNEIFQELGVEPGSSHCETMDGLIQDGQKIIDGRGEANVKDAALIAAAQRAEHYEMAGYGVAETYARELGYSRAASLLSDTLSEEKAADKKLNKLATGGWLTSGINKEAREETTSV